MKVLMLITGNGPMVILSSHQAPDDDVLVGKLKAKGIEKFMAYELPLDEVRKKYGGHFQAVVNDLHETDDLRVLDMNGQRVFGLFRLRDLGKPFIHEPDDLKTKVYVD
ncbi:MAG: hypothetical protein P8Y25_03945 [Chromatiaceae bacterium]|jgi:hypothetical protein